MGVKTKTFSGGYIFKRFDCQAADILTPIPGPEKVVVPLRQASGGDADENVICVKIGERVKAGQVVGRSEGGRGLPVHSSVDGEVERIVEIDCFGSQVPAVAIRSDGEQTDICKVEGWTPGWEDKSAEEVADILREAGVFPFSRDCAFHGEPNQPANGPPNEPSSALINESIPLGEIKDLIICALDPEMYRVSMAVLLKAEAVNRFATGLRILKKAAPRAKLHVVFDENDAKLLSDSSAALEKEGLTGNVELHGVVSKYPQAFDRLLARTVLKKTVSPGKEISSLGAMAADVQAVLHAFDAAVEGRPVLDRVIALAGPGFVEPTHVRARLGTAVEHVVRGRLAAPAEDLRLIVNSPLTGPSVKKLSQPVEHYWSRIIAVPEDREHRFLPFISPGADMDSYSPSFLSSFFPTDKKTTTNPRGEMRPCISCGFCEQVCPAQIVPHLLHKYSSRSIIGEHLLALRIFDCVDCNLCSYVCPCKIPVGIHVKQGKQRLVEDGIAP